MSHEYKVAPKSRVEIEHLACAWRDALGLNHDCLAPDLVSLLENELPKLFSDFALVVKEDSQMDGAEGYTEFDPPRIVLAESTYIAAADQKGRGRWTAAHELGHLVLHKGAVPFERANTPYSRMKALPVFESAEWQANAFAAGFLMPAHLVRDFAEIDEIMAFFSVSRQAGENRVNTLSLVAKRTIAPEVMEALRPTYRR